MDYLLKKTDDKAESFKLRLTVRMEIEQTTSNIIKKFNLKTAKDLPVWYMKSKQALVVDVFEISSKKFTKTMVMTSHFLFRYLVRFGPVVWSNLKKSCKM